MIKLGEFDSVHGTITVSMAESTGSVIYEQHGHYQSEADGDGTSLTSYIHALFGLVSQTSAQSVLMIGGAGSTLGTMLVGAGRRVTIVDIDPMSFPLARQYFSLPESIECHVDDGEAFLTATRDAYDTVVVDAYVGDRIPTHFQSSSFFKLVRSRLSRQGVALVNVYVTDDADDTANQIAAQMADAWTDVRILDTQGLQGRNAIVMAGEVSELTRPYVLVPPMTEANTIDSELALMQFRAPPTRP